MPLPSAFDVPEQGLAALLKIVAPPLVADKQPFRQLEYVLQYVRKLGCSVMLVESEYVDRDYMQDHSAFYAASFARYGSVCRRIHFFRALARADIFNAIANVGRVALESRKAYRTACDAFSEEKYLGFCVVKPLPGSPVGRTVLRPYPSTEPGLAHRRLFEPTRRYTTHLLGIELTVCGLAFQQQDQGVSACATTAVWSSLQKLRDFEDIAAATPAQITSLASRFALPYGRSLPSEGLSLDQMCQAIHALGISPNLVRVTGFWQVRSVLYSAVASGIAAILIIENPKRDASHAVAAVGLKVRKDHAETLRLHAEGKIAFVGNTTWLDDISADLIGVYVHDDRLGPYVATKFEEREFKDDRTGKPVHLPCIIIDESGNAVPWIITHVLMPVHGKVRTAVAQMIDFSAKFAAFAYSALRVLKKSAVPVETATRVVRAHHYVEELAADPAVGGTDRLGEFFTRVELSRYVGVTTLTLPELGRYDVLVDTTGTARNANCLAIICRGPGGEISTTFVGDFAARFGCKSVA